MNEPQVNQPVPTATLPRQVWGTLTPSQQKIILQTIIQMCQRLVSQHNQEQNDEPAPTQSVILQ